MRPSLLLIWPVILIGCCFGFTALKAQNTSLADTAISLYLSDTVPVDIGEVVITATRTSKRIIDIPYPVSRLNYVDYRHERKLGVDQLLSSVPGMFLQSRYGNHDVRVSIRGFGSRSNSGIRGVRILLDDIPESEPDGQTRIEAIDFNSIGRIEVAKGNLSSLYTNAPGGVVNFINDIDFMRSSVSLFNQFGDFGLQRNGIKAAYRGDNLGVLTTFSNHRYTGYREHNHERWHIVNSVVETNPTENSTLKLLFYFADGYIKLPGSLTKEEFEINPYQADQRAVDRDMKRLSTKGRLGIRYTSNFGKKKNNNFELTSYATVKYFERASREYRIINRNGFGLRASYGNQSKLWGRTNEFAIGVDVLYQPARTEYYDNIGGQKGDQINQLTQEKIYNNGFYISDQFALVPERFFVLLSGRYDKVSFDLKEETLPSRIDSRSFDAFMPKLAFHYKINPWIAAYTSYSLSFDSPAKNELESLDPSELYNHDLIAQQTKSFELGIKGNIIRDDAYFFSKLLFEITAFDMNIDNEVVPYEVYNEVYYRNAAKTKRRGLELGSTLEILTGLSWSLSYTFSDFNYKTYAALSIAIDSTGSIVSSEEDYSGHVVPSVPRNNLFSAISYALPISQYVDAFAKLSYHGVSGLWVDDANTDQTDAYHLLNGLVGLEMKVGGLNVLLSGGLNNLLDEVYVGFTNTNSADRRFYEAGAPRNYHASLNIGYRF